VLGKAHVDLLAAPVLADPQYSKRPVYSSTLIVAATSVVTGPEGLRGGVAAYNDEASLSGFHVLRHWLARHAEEPAAFFESWVRAGSHRRALEMVAEGLATCAACDNLVLQRIRATEPELAARVRALDGVQLAMSPIQPVVARRSLEPEARAALAEALCRLGAGVPGDAPTGLRFVERFVRVLDEHYDGTREILRVAAQVGGPAEPPTRRRAKRPRRAR